MTPFAALALLFFLLPMVGRFCPCRSWRRQGGDRREKNGTKASKRAGDKSALFCFGSHVKAPGSVVCAVAPMHITDLLYVTQWCIRAAMGRGGFRLDCFWESTDIGPPEGRPGSGFVFFLPKSAARFPARQDHCVAQNILGTSTQSCRNVFGESPGRRHQTGIHCLSLAFP